MTRTAAKAAILAVLLGCAAQAAPALAQGTPANAERPLTPRTPSSIPLTLKEVKPDLLPDYRARRERRCPAHTFVISGLAALAMAAVALIAGRRGNAGTLAAT